MQPVLSSSNPSPFSRVFGVGQGACMTRISYKRRRFPAVVIQHAVWLYFRFTLSLRDVEEMLAQRGIEARYETIVRMTRHCADKHETFRR